MKIINLDHLNTLPGGVGQPWDRARVLDEVRTAPHPITGEQQPVCLFAGTLEECHEYVARESK